MIRVCKYWKLSSVRNWSIFAYYMCKPDRYLKTRKLSTFAWKGNFSNFHKTPSKKASILNFCKFSWKMEFSQFPQDTPPKKGLETKVFVNFHSTLVTPNIWMVVTLSGINLSIPGWFHLHKQWTRFLDKYHFWQSIKKTCFMICWNNFF
jgi:hypothetical protein